MFKTSKCKQVFFDCFKAHVDPGTNQTTTGKYLRNVTKTNVLKFDVQISTSRALINAKDSTKSTVSYQKRLDIQKQTFHLWSISEIIEN